MNDVCEPAARVGPRRERSGPRVLIVSSFLPKAGSGQTMAPLARQIDSLRALGVQVSTVNVQGLPKLKYLQTVGPLRRAARNVDIVHAHYGFCGWLGWTTRKPLVISFMGDDLLGTPDAQGKISRLSTYFVRSSRWIARRADAVIVKSREMAEVIAPTPADVIPNGVDVEQFRKREQREVRRRLGWPNDRRYVLFPGDPELPRKGFAFARRAFEAAQAQLDEALELKVLWGVEPSDVAYFMNACDAMLMTSYIEGSPNVVKEAMASDLPVVSVPVGDVETLLADVPGCRVVPRQPDAVGSALAAVLRDRPAEGGRAAIHRLGLDLNSVAIRVLRVYQRVLAARV